MFEIPSFKSIFLLSLASFCCHYAYLCMCVWVCVPEHVFESVSEHVFESVFERVFECVFERVFEGVCLSMRLSVCV